MPVDLKRVILSAGIGLVGSTLVSATSASEQRAVKPLDYFTTREASTLDFT